jgi:hypothetical protein
VHQRRVRVKGFVTRWLEHRQETSEVDFLSIVQIVELRACIQLARGNVDWVESLEPLQLGLSLVVNCVSIPVLVAC